MKRRPPTPPVFPSPPLFRPPPQPAAARRLSSPAPRPERIRRERGGGRRGRQADPPAGGPNAHRSRRRCRRCSAALRSEEHTSELQSQSNLVCRLLLEKKKEN